MHLLVKPTLWLVALLLGYHSVQFGNTEWHVTPLAHNWVLVRPKAVLHGECVFWTPGCDVFNSPPHALWLRVQAFSHMGLTAAYLVFSQVLPSLSYLHEMKRGIWVGWDWGFVHGDCWDVCVLLTSGGLWLRCLIVLFDVLDCLGVDEAACLSWRTLLCLG